MFAARNMMFAGGVGSSGPICTYLQAAEDVGNLTTYTFASQNLGDVIAARRIIICAAGRTVGSPTISSITVGGVAATIVCQTSLGGNAVGIAIAAIPTGSTGNVVVAFSRVMVRAAIDVFHVSSDPTLHDFDTSIANPPAVNLDVPAGFAVGAAIRTSNVDVAWTGLIKRSDLAPEGAVKITSASQQFMSSETGRPISADYAGGGGIATFASWS